MAELAQGQTQDFSRRFPPRIESEPIPPAPFCLSARGGGGGKITGRVKHAEEGFIPSIREGRRKKSTELSRKGLQRRTAELELAWRVRGTEQSRQRPLKVGGLFWRKAVERESQGSRLESGLDGVKLWPAPL